MTSQWTRLLKVFSFYLLIWLVLAQGNLSSLILGLPFAILASLVYLKLRTSFYWQSAEKLDGTYSGFSVLGMLRLMGFFLFNSLVGAQEIARLLLKRDMKPSVEVIDYQFRLHSVSARVLMAYLQNLLPGTLAVQVRDEGMQIHVIGDIEMARQALLKLELTIADMVGQKDIANARVL